MIYRQDFYNLQTRKKSEMVQTVQIEFSISSILQDLKYELMLA